MRTRDAAFIMVPAWYLHSGKATGTDMLVLVALQSFQGNNGLYPSMSAIAKRAGLSKRTVINAIGRLCEEGVLKKMNRRTSDGGNLTNVYSVMWDRNQTENFDEGVVHYGSPLVNQGSGGSERTDRYLVNEDAPKLDILTRSELTRGARARGNSKNPTNHNTRRSGAHADLLAGAARVAAYGADRF